MDRCMMISVYVIVRLEMYCTRLSLSAATPAKLKYGEEMIPAYLNA
jgi:hypothetical protein